MSITRDKLIPKIGQEVNIQANSHWYTSVRILDVGDIYVFALNKNHTDCPHQLISLGTIDSVTWREEISHRIDGEKAKAEVSSATVPKPKPAEPKRETPKAKPNG